MASSAVLVEHSTPPHSPHTSTLSPRNTTSCVLPYIDPSAGVVGGGESAPLISDFLPPDLVLALQRQGSMGSPPRGAKMPPPGRFPLAQSKTDGAVPTRPPASIWNHNHRRARLRHLTDHPPCICGAGKDISFLYDVAPKESPGQEDASIPTSTIPGTLIPEEYHIVKHPGVMGLEFHDEPFTTRSEDHAQHMTIFPSMRPAGRHEAVCLKHTMDQMLQRAGVPHELTDSNLQGPTEMHNLLELIRLEQDIYNVCFHELIRQVSVHCVERGELLADLRRRYSNLLDRVPRQVKRLHDEVVAQRALDRRLTSELKRFKSRISSLTKDLADVREHNLQVTEQSRDAQDNLATTLADSEKNASLLAEYHDLYELQRKRLEDQVAQLTQERELWQQASYKLAHKVAEDAGLRTVRRLQLCEKAWVKLAGHFAITLSSRDTQQLLEVQGCVQRWREEVVGVDQRLGEVEESMRDKLEAIGESLKQWREEFNNVVDSSGVVHAPERAWLQRLWREMRRWQEVLNEQSDHFSGDTLLSRLEELKKITTLVENWTDVSVQIFSRHEEGDAIHKQEGEAPIHKQEVEGSTHKQEGEPPTHSREQEMMLSLNARIRSCLSHYITRLSGENGVATGFIHLITPLETWDSKFSLLLNSTDRKLPDSEWIKFRTLLGEWEEQIRSIWGYIGHTPTSPDESLTLELVLQDVEKWRSSLSYATDSQDMKTANQVWQLHSALVQWMVQLLLAMTGTQGEQEEEEEKDGEEEGEEEEEEEEEKGEEEKGKEEEGREEEGGDVDRRREEEGQRHAFSTADLKAEFVTLSESLNDFTTGLTRSCMDIVREAVDERRREGYSDAEEEQEELRRLGEEVGKWSKLAGLLLQGLAEGEHGEQEEGGSRRELPEGKESRKSSVASEGGAEMGLPREMSVMGVDDNIHPKSLQQAIAETRVSPMASRSQLGLATEEAIPEGRGALQKDAEALVISLDQTTQKLKEQEELTGQAEERAGRAEKELEESKERISQLESELQQLKSSTEQASKVGASGGLSSRPTTKGGRKVSRPGVGQPPPSRSESRKRL